MIIVEKTPGEKIPYEVAGNLLMLDQQLYLNLPSYERDYDVHIDISSNEFGFLVMGTARAYVAEIDIPAREYKEVVTGEDEEGNPVTERQPQPFDIEKVTLTLWGVTA
ncbi:hypothetical protein ACF5W4_11045 [Bacillota bacterium Lsc_1132]